MYYTRFMKKKKVINAFIRVLKTIARVLILNIPAVIILLGLLAANKLSWISAGVSLLAFWAISGIIVFYVFKDLDNFMIYLKKLAQGIEPELPKLRWGIFSSMNLTKSFLSVKNLWSNQFLSDSSVLENLPNPLLMIAPDQKVVFANLSAINFFNNSLINKKLKLIFNDKTLTDSAQSVIAATSNSITLSEWEFENKDKKLLTFQIKFDRLPAPTKDGAVVSISFFDITPFKLFKAQQADFFANASHELKTPLAIINGCVETLQTSAKNDPKAQEQFLSLIAEQSTRMTNLIQNMLKLSRMQLDVPQNRKKAFSINDLIQKVVTDLSVRAQTLNKKISFNKQNHLPLFSANREELYHVFLNLLDNALKYSAPNSTISVNTYSDSTQNSRLVISVHNEGDPIPEDKIDRIWDKFYRVTDSNNSVEGSGLGLGIVQQIISKYQGHIEVESSSQKGTTFTVYLPI